MTALTLLAALVLTPAPTPAPQVQAALTRSVLCAEDLDGLRSMPLPAPGRNRCVRMMGRGTPGDGGGGDFYWDSNSTQAENGGTVFLSDHSTQGRWMRLTDGHRISATWFGALPDDGVDDTVALQSAISFAETPVGGMGPDVRNRASLFLPRGRYEVEGTLRIRNSLDFHGADSSSTYLVHTGSDTDLLRIESEDEDGNDEPDPLYDVSLRRMTLQGNGTQNGQSSQTRFGVYMFHGIRGCTLEDVTILRCQTAAFLRRCYSAKVMNCVMMFCSDHTLKWENATSGVISGCRFDVAPNGSHCVFVTFDHTNGQETVGLLVEGSSFQGSSLAGLYCRDVGNLTVVSCFFENNNRDDLGYGSLHLEDANNQPFDVEEHVLTVVGGFWSPGSSGGPTSRGIYVENTERVNLTGVDLRGSDFQYAVDVRAGVKSVNLIGCNFHGRPRNVAGGVQVNEMGSD